MSIVVKYMKWTTVGGGMGVGKMLTRREQRQIKDQIEKFLRRRYSITCETDVR